MVGLSRSSNSSRSSRRRLAQGAKGNASSCCRPRSRHNLFLQTRPSLSATACSWFMMRVRACTIRCRCHSSCRRSRFSQLGTQIRGKRSSVQQAQQQPGILTIRLRLAYPLGFNLRCVADPQLKVQLRQQSFKPACMSTGFHPHSHLHSLRRQVSVKLFRFLAVLQPPFFIRSGPAIHKRNLLEARVLIASYNDHCPAPFSEPSWLVSTTKSTRAWEPALLWNPLDAISKGAHFYGKLCHRKGAPYESREVYRHGRSSSHHFRCREECGGQAAHGMRAGNQGSHDSGVHSRTAWNSGVDLRGRHYGNLVTRSAEASCPPAGGLRSAQERADEGWQPERPGGCTQLGGTTPHQPRPCGGSREAWNPCFKRVGAELLDPHQGQYPGDESH